MGGAGVISRIIWQHPYARGIGTLEVCKKVYLKKQTSRQYLNGVLFHTEGWISMYDVSEKSFSNKILAVGNIPRKKGWKVINHLGQKLSAISK